MNDTYTGVLGDRIKLIGSSKRSVIIGMDLFGYLYESTMLIIGNIFVILGNITLTVDIVNSNINKHGHTNFENLRIF